MVLGSFICGPGSCSSRKSTACLDNSSIHAYGSKPVIRAESLYEEQDQQQSCLDTIRAESLYDGQVVVRNHPGLLSDQQFIRGVKTDEQKLLEKMVSENYVNNTLQRERFELVAADDIIDLSGQSTKQPDLLKDILDLEGIDLSDNYLRKNLMKRRKLRPQSEIILDSHAILSDVIYQNDDFHGIFGEFDLKHNPSLRSLLPYPCGKTNSVLDEALVTSAGITMVPSLSNNSYRCQLGSCDSTSLSEDIVENTHDTYCVPRHTRSCKKRSRRRPRKGRNGVREEEQDNNLGSGVDLTLSELQEMAMRQQRQIDDQQQHMVAKEQRLKFLKQQEVRHQQIASENERLRKLREKVEAQELKLKKLRAIRGQVTEQKGTNNTLSSELECIRALFNDKEKELSMAVSRVEELSKQLDQLRRGQQINGLQAADIQQNASTPQHSAAIAELNKLRKEIVIRNKLNDQQNSKLTAHRDILKQRTIEMATMDQRISELQQRLRTKKQMQEELHSNRNHSNNILSNQQKPWISGGNVATVEPYRVSEAGTLSKNDPKYQSLPYNVKFPDPLKDIRGHGQGQISTGLPINKPVKNVAMSTSSYTDQQGTPVSVATQGSPSILYAAGESPGNPQTSTPVFTGQQNGKSAQHLSTPVSSKHQPNTVGDKKEIFITGAPAQSSSHHRTGSQTQNLSPPTNHHHQADRSSPSQSHIPPPVTQGNVTSPQYAQRDPRDTSPANKTAQGYHERQGSLQDGQRMSSPTHHGSSGYHERPGSLQEGNMSPSQVGFHERQGSDERRGMVRQGASDSSLHGNKPVRYATHDEIASTYCPTGKVTSEAMDQYRKNMSQLYKDMSKPDSSDPSLNKTDSSTDKTSPPGGGNKADTSGNQPIKGPASPSGKTTKESPIKAQGPIKVPISTSKQHEGRSSPDMTRGSPYNIDPERRYLGNKQPHHHAPRPLRRRHSSGGDSPEGYPKAKHTADPAEKYPRNSSTQHASQQQRNVVESSLKPDDNRVGVQSNQSTTMSQKELEVIVADSSKKKERVINPPDLIRVDQIQRDGDEEEGDEPLNNVEIVDNNSGVDNNTAASAVIAGSVVTAKAQDGDIPFADDDSDVIPGPDNTRQSLPVALRRKKGNLKSADYVRSSRRVSFDPLALLLDAALEGELDLVVKSAHEVRDPSCPNDEGITALHNAICAGHNDIVKFLVEYGCNVNSPDSDGWTPLHCAASCNNLGMVRTLVEHGACIFAETISDHETAAEKCEEDEEGYHGCSQYLYSIQEKLGIANKGVVYAVFDYEGQGSDELPFNNGDSLTVIRKGDDKEREWWWASRQGQQGYIPRNLLGMFPRVVPKWLDQDDDS